MHRTVWFVAFCLLSLGTLAAIKAFTAFSVVAVTAPPADMARARLALTDGLVSNRAAKADRLPLSASSIATLDLFTPRMAMAPSDEEVPDTPAAAITDKPATTEDSPHSAARTTAHRRWQDANAKLIDTPPKRRQVHKPQLPAQASATQDKSVVNVLPCRQDAGASFLRALDLTPRCGS
jgi:hypothetical protein